MKELLLILGTRPEAIKLLPIAWELRSRGIAHEILNTNQHGEILDRLLESDGIRPRYKLSVCGRHRDLLGVKSAMMTQIYEVLSSAEPSAVVVQGDTLSALVGAEYGFLSGIPVYHVEAGMRTYNTRNPYPEESFRRMIAAMSTLHFAPSADEACNLLREGFPLDTIHVVGNTFVDYRKRTSAPIPKPKKQILITLHRRENLPHLEFILRQIAKIVQNHREYSWLFPVHPNPTVKALAELCLGGVSGVTLCEPMSPEHFYRELLASEMVISDSGGVQEECILNAKKLLVIRETSERRTDFYFTELASPTETLEKKFDKLLSRSPTSVGTDYYGSGGAANRIVEIISGR